jgi:hypothetical protein
MLLKFIRIRSIYKLLPGGSRSTQSPDAIAMQDGVNQLAIVSESGNELNVVTRTTALP